MTKSMKISSVIFSMVLAAALMFLFAGCSSEISSSEGAKAVVAAAEKYQNSHVDYQNFDDITFNYTTKSDAKQQVELVYRDSLDAETTKKGTFTDSVYESEEVTFAVKNVTRGEGDLIVKDLHMMMTIKIVEKSTTYELDANDVLKTVVVDKTTTKTFIAASKEDQGVVSYYVKSDVKVVEPGKDDIQTKKYYEYDNRNDYMDRLEDYIGEINETVTASYFGDAVCGEYVLLFGKCTKDGNKIEMNYDLTVPEVSPTGACAITMQASVSFNGKDIDTASAKMISENATSKAINETGVKAKASSSDIQIGDLTGYDKSDDEIIFDEISGMFD